MSARVSALDFDQTTDPRRLLAIAGVIAIHAVAVYGLFQWGVRGRLPLTAAPVQVALITEQPVEVQPIRPPEPKFATPELTIEQPVIDVPTFADPAPQAITVAFRTEPAPVKAVSAPTPKMVSTVEYLRPLKPQYPPQSRRLHEEGLVVLLVLVDEEGRASRIEVRDSSGHQRLDRAAQDAVERARFKPYLENGIARSAFVLIPVEFSLNNQRVAQR